MIDPTGAGDAFAAGLLTAWCAGAEPAEALAAGAALGSAAVGRVARPSLVVGVDGAALGLLGRPAARASVRECCSRCVALLRSALDFGGRSLAISTAAHGRKTMPAAQRISQSGSSGGLTLIRMAPRIRQTARRPIIET